MMRYEPGDVLLVPFPFSDLSGAKQRPALVLVRHPYRGELVCMMLTSVASGDPWEVQLAFWREAGLLKPTVARVPRLFTIAEGLVYKRLGKLAPEDFACVRQRLKAFLDLDA